METMPEMGGDCEDTSILLASVLQAEPFGYDTILIQPPGHMAVGIYQESPAGYYWELDGRTYSYIETTGQGWASVTVPRSIREPKPIGIRCEVLPFSPVTGVAVRRRSYRSARGGVPYSNG